MNCAPAFHELRTGTPRNAPHPPSTAWTARGAFHGLRAAFHELRAAVHELRALRAQVRAGEHQEHRAAR
eukprot:1844986-Rhodomonas_salina.1